MTQIYINGKDAQSTWGIVTDTSTLAALLTPPPQKELITNESRLTNGMRVYSGARRIASRDISLSLQLVASTEEQFFKQYDSFCQELAGGRLVITTTFRPDVYYRCDYISCTQFAQYMRGIAKFTLKLNEPDPSNRGAKDKYDTSQ